MWVGRSRAKWRFENSIYSMYKKFKHNFLIYVFSIYIIIIIIIIILLLINSVGEQE